MLRMRTGAAFLAVALLGGCGTSPTAERPPAAENPVPQTRGIATRLGQQGATDTFADVMPSSSHPYFAVPAARYQLNGESLLAFEYGSSEQAAGEAARIAPDGRSIGSSQVDWVSDPHFYRSGAVVALYVGRAPETTHLLEAVLGPQVAGR